ncbi:MAG: DUF222 domain-containing protein [Specibacter sp.]
METTAGTPGNPGSTRAQAAVGAHIHQLLRLAAALAPSSACPADPSSADQPGFTVEAPLGVELATLTDAQAIGWGQSLEQLDHILSALQVQVAGELAARTRASRFSEAGFTKPVALLTTSLKLGAAEASRRVRLAEHFLPVTDLLTTVTTPPTQPVLGSAFFRGELSTEQALVVSAFTDDACHLADAGRIPAYKARELETTLTEYARDEPPDFLRRVGTRAVNLLDPDGQQPSDGELLAKQGIFFRNPRRGMVHFDGHLSVPQYETLMSAIGWATNPNRHVDINTFDPLTDPPHTQDGGATAGGARTAGAGDAAGGADDGQVLPGQMDLQDFIANMSAAFGATQGPSANGWPPPQGPVPAWASAEAGGYGDAGSRDEGSAGAGRAGAAGGTESSMGAAGGTESSTGTAPTPWPHLVNGITVPEPGTEQDLPGLDPIDPTSTDPAVADRRTHGQKLLDGLIDCVKLAARTGRLPLNGGLKPQLFISTTETDLERRTSTGSGGGIAFLPYSGPQPLELFKVELCNPDVTTMVLGGGGDILNVGRTQRLFTAAQRKILLARDMGCTFPDCTAPANWCDAHHIIPWQDGGDTSVANGVLLCSLHHHLVHRGHWSIKIRDGVPWYTPSYGIDPARRPRRNNYHHGLAGNRPPRLGQAPQPPDVA